MDIDVSDLYLLLLQYTGLHLSVCLCPSFTRHEGRSALIGASHGKPDWFVRQCLPGCLSVCLPARLAACPSVSLSGSGMYTYVAALV